ncbi:MAG: hypothetical protein AVDCRST_MAG66-3690 [uncultured Pseudonocardia sp.]|uniref:Uncharacterized protein n=1 Tax=uncultured Pseudonocardia sp. TaxID=211455 RepID=A0A6J4Q8Z9_9PSEU|nr:MAG: hypothetical protein AVDCRST_MAG66-3690 [uncultured Pseudonocardia sp.]
MQNRPRPAWSLANPYDTPVPRRRTGAGAVAGAVVAGTAGLVVLGAGTAAAEPTDDEGGWGPSAGTGQQWPDSTGGSFPSFDDDLADYAFHTEPSVQLPVFEADPEPLDTSDQAGAGFGSPTVELPDLAAGSPDPAGSSDRPGEVFPLPAPEGPGVPASTPVPEPAAPPVVAAPEVPAPTGPVATDLVVAPTGVGAVGGAVGGGVPVGDGGATPVVVPELTVPSEDVQDVPPPDPGPPVAAEPSAEPAPGPVLGLAEDVSMTLYAVTAEDPATLDGTGEAVNTGSIGWTDERTTATLDALLGLGADATDRTIGVGADIGTGNGEPGGAGPDGSTGTAPAVVPELIAPTEDPQGVPAPLGTGSDVVAIGGGADDGAGSGGAGWAGGGPDGAAPGGAAPASAAPDGAGSGGRAPADPPTVTEEEPRGDADPLADDVVAAGGTPASQGGSTGATPRRVPWWSDPAIVGVRSNGEPLPPTLLFPDVRQGQRLSSADVNPTVVDQLSPSSAPSGERRAEARSSWHTSNRVEALDRLAQDARTLSRAPGVNDELANAFTQLRIHTEGGTPDFSGVAPEALNAAARQLELAGKYVFRPDPGPIRDFAGALGELAEFTGELPAEQSTRLFGALARSSELEAAAVRLAQDNLATSRLRSSQDPAVDQAVRFLRTVCGDTATANAMCAPLDEGVVPRHSGTGQLTGRVPHGVLPPQVRFTVDNVLPAVNRIIDRTASPHDVLKLEQSIQEVNTMLSAVLPEGVPNELPRDAERRRLLDEAYAARSTALGAARDAPGSAAATEAYREYLRATSALLRGMGVHRDPTGALILPQRGDEVPATGNPTSDLVQSERYAAAAASVLLGPRVAGRLLVEGRAGSRPPVQPPVTGDITAGAGAPDTPQEQPAGDGASVVDGEPAGDEQSSSGAGVVVAPEIEPVRDPRRDIFAGDPLGPQVELPELDQPVGDPADPGEFDPNAGNRRTTPEPDLLAEGVPGFPGRDQRLEDALTQPGLPRGVFGSPLGPEEAVPAGRPGAGESTGTSSPALQPEVGPVPVVQPGSTRTGSDGQVQRHVEGQDLVGDGRPGTTPGRVDYFSSADGTTEAVVQSPRRDNGNGTSTVWMPDLGETVATNPLGRTTSVQRVASPGSPAGTPMRTVQIRTGEHVEQLAGGGAGSEPGSVTYRPVPGRPDQQDVIVEPTVTEVEHPDGSTTITYSAMVPTNRQWNPSGQGERFRVAVGTPMRAVRNPVFIPAPAPAPTPVTAPNSEWAPSPALTSPARATTPGTRTQQRTAPAAAQPSAPQRRTTPAPTPTAAPATTQQQEPNGWQRAGQTLIDVITYPHPLDPARGALRGIWPYIIPGANSTGERRWSY